MIFLPPQLFTLQQYKDCAYNSTISTPCSACRANRRKHTSCCSPSFIDGMAICNALSPVYKYSWNLCKLNILKTANPLWKATQKLISTCETEYPLFEEDINSSNVNQQPNVLYHTIGFWGPTLQDIASLTKLFQKNSQKLEAFVWGRKLLHTVLMFSSVLWSTEASLCPGFLHKFAM